MQYRVDELAARAGVSVDTIRFYQSRKLLPGPRRAGRIALYSDAHLARLRRIRELAARGAPLALIRRVLDARRPSRDDALLSAVLEKEEDARSLSREELAARAGIPPALLASIEAAGLIEPAQAPDGSVRYTEADARILEAGLTLLDTGFPLDEILTLATTYHRAVEETVDRAIDLFDRHVRRPADAGSAANGRVADSFRRLLPAVIELVANHFQRTLVTRALRRLENTGDQEGLAAAIGEGSRVAGSVRWRR
jgi:DNA-binding transcriptional MerR regulator